MLLRSSSARASRAGLNALHAGGLVKPKVLLIEDDRTLRRLVRAKINEHCDLVTGENAAHGLSQFNHHKPDMVFLDIELPDGSGYNLLDWMLRVDPQTFAVMFSGFSDNEHVWRSVESGAKGFVSKPFDAAKMLFFINQCKH